MTVMDRFFQLHFSLALVSVTGLPAAATVTTSPAAATVADSSFDLAMSNYNAVDRADDDRADDDRADYNIVYPLALSFSNGVDLQTLVKAQALPSSSASLLLQPAISAKEIVPTIVQKELGLGNFFSPPQSAQATDPIDPTVPIDFTPLHRVRPGDSPFQPSKLFQTVSEAEQAAQAARSSLPSPATTVGIPSAYGASWGAWGVGVGFQNRTRFTQQEDGGIGVGLGFGNPVDNVALQVGINFVDVSDPLADGSISLKLHRRLPEDLAIALGATGVLTWGNPDGGSSVYGVVTKRFQLRDSPDELLSSVTTSLGVGSGQFRSEASINDGTGTVGVFGSVSVRMAAQVSSVAEWTGQDLTLGVSFLPLRSVPLVITPAVADITGTAGDGPRFILGVGYGIRF